MNPIAIHVFTDTHDAYDACQCLEEVRSGDILLVYEDDQKLVGIVGTWPLAVTEPSGGLHQLLAKATFQDFTGMVHEMCLEDREDKQAEPIIKVALALAKGLGIELAEYAKAS